MALKERISDEMKAALLGGNRFVGEVLRNLKAAILNEEVARNLRDTGLLDSDIEQLIAREVKKRRESIAIYESNSRQDLADNEKAELEVLEKYLPKQLGEAELSLIVKQKIAELGLSGPQAMGQIIGAVKKDVGNAADGALLAKIVKEFLTQDK